MITDDYRISAFLAETEINTKKPKRISKKVFSETNIVTHTKINVCRKIEVNNTLNHAAKFSACMGLGWAKYLSALGLGYKRNFP